MAARFRYRTELDDHQIRVLRIHAGEPVDHVKYSALSYVWGNSALLKSIVVNKQTPRVTKNLHETLTT